MMNKKEINTGINTDNNAENYTGTGFITNLLNKRNVIKNLYAQVLATAADDSDARAELVSELLKHQKPDGSFSVVDDYHIDSDARVDFIYYPTYYATAAMIFALNHGESGAEFQDALVKGLNFSTGRNLMGPGFEATAWQLETLAIYKKAGLYEFLKTHGDEYAAFRDLINKIIEGYRQALAANSTIRDFAREFRKEFEAEVNEYEANLA